MVIKLNISEKAVAALSLLQRQTQRATVGEVLRDAIFAFGWILDQQEQGYKICAMKDGEVKANFVGSND